MQSQNIQILAKSLKTTDEIVTKFDLVVDLIKEDVMKILKSKGLDLHEFDSYYSAGVFKLKRSLNNKQYLQGVKRFFRCENIEIALKLFLRKLTSNVRNEYQTSRSGSLAGFKKTAETYLIDGQVSDDILDLLIREEETEKSYEIEDNENGNRQLIFIFD